MSKINTVKEIAVKVSDTGTENDYVKKPIGTDAENVDRVNGETVEESLTRIENTHGTYDTYGSVKLLSPNTPPPPSISDVTGLALSAGEKDKTAKGTLAHELFSLNLKYEDPYLKLLDKDGNELSRVAIISVNHEHGYAEEITREANCTETGLKTFTCACGESYTQEIPVNGIHNFVDGVCTRCGKEYDPTETAPAETEAHSNWNYTLNEADKTITLNRYIGNEEDVIVYGNYVIDRVNYKTKLKYTAKLFYYGDSNPNNTIRTIKFSREINTSNVSDMSYMFSGCQSLVSLDVSSFDTSNVTNMSYMFSSCRSLVSLDVSSFDTSNVTRITSMFSSCRSLTSLDLSNFIISNVRSLYQMFVFCQSLVSLDLSNFDTSNVTDMIYMFKGATSLKTIYVSRDKWITSQADTLDMFRDCGTSEVTYK